MEYLPPGWGLVCVSDATDRALSFKLYFRGYFCLFVYICECLKISTVR